MWTFRGTGLPPNVRHWLIVTRRSRLSVAAPVTDWQKWELAAVPASSAIECFPEEADLPALPFTRSTSSERHQPPSTASEFREMLCLKPAALQGLLAGASVEGLL